MESESQDLLLINSKVEIIKDEALKYKAEVTTKAKKLIVLSMGESYNSFEIKEGNKLTYCWGTNTNINRTFYSFSSEVKMVKHEDFMLHIGIYYPKKVEKLGVRRFFRLPIKLDIYYFLINFLDHYQKVDEVPMGYFLNMKEASTIDISGNGAKIVIDVFCRKGQEVAVVIPQLNNLKLLATIEWLEPDKFNQNIDVAFSFKNIREHDQDKIVSFVFSKVHEMKKT